MRETYKVLIKSSAEKQLKKLPTNIKLKIDKLIRSLAENPRPNNVKKLAGYDNAYRVRHADYRIVYSIEDDKLIVEVVRVAHRKKVYKGL